MNKRLWIVFAFLVLAALGGLIIWKKSDNKQMDFSSYDGSKLITSANVGDGQIPDHYFGNKDSKVIVIEYEDFACSACNSFASSASKIHEDYKDKVLFIYRNFNIGQNTSTLSEGGAEAAYMMGGQDVYWKMHDLIFSNSLCVEGSDRDGCNDEIVKHAATLGLDVNKFKAILADYSNNGIQTKIQRDKALGLKAGVRYTPTWFINGAKVEGANESLMRREIESALNK